MASSSSLPREALLTSGAPLVAATQFQCMGFKYNRGDRFNHRAVPQHILLHLFDQRMIMLDEEFARLPVPAQPDGSGNLPNPPPLGPPLLDPDRPVPEAGLGMWLISVPVWGHRYRTIFAERAAPALKIALDNLQEYLQQSGPLHVRIRFHTDQPGFAHGLFPDYLVDYVNISPDATYTTLQYSHKDAINVAAPGDRVGLLNADLVVSANLFVNVEKRFREGKQAIVVIGIRTELRDEVPPQGAPPRALLAWAWDHRHQIIKDNEWGSGSSALPTNIFWSNGENVVGRGFHLHPVAIVKTQNLNFRSTIDGDMLDYYPRDQIHVVTDPDEMALLEMSDPSRRFHLFGHVMDTGMVAQVMFNRASPLHCWQFTHRIIIRGDGEGIDDIPVTADILQRMGGASRFGG